jgi:hypothetical protein
MGKSTDILTEAQLLTWKSKTWVDLCNALFNPADGLVCKYFPDSVDRRAFSKTKEYALLFKLVEFLMERDGVWNIE